MKLTPQQYNDIYQKLPPEIFDLVNSAKTTEQLYNIAEKHHLHIDEAGIMHDIVMDVAMGVIATKNMEAELVRELKISPLDASTIARDVNEQVLAPIKETMIGLYKHSNPFKPQTMQYVDEHDEEDETKLDRSNLLNEIENPQKAEVKKVITQTSLPIIQTPKTNSESILPKTEGAPSGEEKVDDPLKQMRERILKSITEEKLASIVTMSKHQSSPDQVKQSDIKVENTKNIESQVGQNYRIEKIAPNTVSITKKDIVETKIPEQPKIVTQSPIATQEKTISQPVPQPTVPQPTKENHMEIIKTPEMHLATKTTIDPYRETV